ncbi:hypothetical protein BC829DRAFT_494380 [Chytridium lagenaria]|nr:hypothetical protein BC829DRAFT_494380 [Chytridium lagenaria]
MPASTWREGVNVSVAHLKSEDTLQTTEKFVLRDVSMEGPSGSGKTTLMNAIAGRTTIKLEGDILFDGLPKTTLLRSGRVAYVPQEDHLLPYLTVRETLTFAANLRLSASMTADEKKSCHASPHEPVHTPPRRTHNRPRCRIRLTPPPTPLTPSYPRTTIVSVHQPRSDLFAMFTHVTFLSSGRVAYAGERGNVMSWFSGMGFETTERVNPADFLIDVLVEAEKAGRIDDILGNGRDGGKRGKGGKCSDVCDRRGFGFDATTGDLLEKGFVDIVGILAEVLIISIVLGYIFFRMDETPGGILSRKSLLYTVCSVQNFLALMFTIWKLSNELVIFDRARADNMHSVEAFMVSWFSVNLFFQAFLSIVFSLIVYVMAGLRDYDRVSFTETFYMKLFVACTCTMGSVTNFASSSSQQRILHPHLSSIHIYIRWLHNLSFLHHGLRIYATIEFHNRRFNCGPNITCSGSMAFDQPRVWTGIERKRDLPSSTVELVNVSLRTSSTKKRLTASSPPSPSDIILLNNVGKSTLLQTICGRLNDKFVRTGVVRVNGQEVVGRMEGMALVRQEDEHLLPGLTARETLSFAAGVSRVAKTTPFHRLALLTNPVVLVLDEPTSGLDSATASNLIHHLKHLASSQNRTIVCTLHQPRADLLPLFDSILLMSRGGRLVFQGSSTEMMCHFEDLGYKIPALTNPADFALDIASID